MKPLTREQIEELRTFDTPTVCNAIERFKVRPNTEGFMKPGMVMRLPIDRPMVGYAATGRVSGAYQGSPLANETLFGYYEQLRAIGDPSIAVIQDIDIDQSYSFWGEVQMATHLALGCVGAIMDGGVRDLHRAAAFGFNLFSTRVNVSHGYVHMVDYGKPVQILGLVIQPGDLLHADQHGIALIPAEIAPQLAEACRKVQAINGTFLERCSTAIRIGERPTLEELRAWRKQLFEQRSQ